MDQTLNSFASLLDPDPLLTPVEEQRRAATALPGMVSRSPMRWLSATDSPNGTGEKLVVGVAAWSGYDLTLLDELNAFAAANPGVRVCVFDVDRVNGEFDRFVPGIGEVGQTPVVGHWKGGVLVAKGSGFDGRQIARNLMSQLAPTAV